MQSYVWKELDAGRQRALLTRPALGANPGLPARVAEIIARVRRDGDAALRALTLELDGVALDGLEVSPAELAAAEAELESDISDTVRGRNRKEPDTALAVLADVREKNARPIEYSLWDSPYLFCFVLGCLGTEWALRKRFGLA